TPQQVAWRPTRRAACLCGSCGVAPPQRLFSVSRLVVAPCLSRKYRRHRRYESSGNAQSASSQNQALNAIVFLYRQVLAGELGEDHLGKIEAVRVRRPARVPTVLSVAEALRVIEAVPVDSIHRPMVELLYGCGLRLMECCTLRVRDVDFDRAQIIIRDAKGM